ncbi:hypothetical protein TNCV_412271 [Trichonephila clavipes]|uniref:Uncharacterized protein n=1 Tax=Trichonephila clavipes TaxID=2585209 RepID=A0A8X6SBY2_TRICX|nr:hypothetical protein TNCV_412271 [Trichonephila clavipes]
MSARRPLLDLHLTGNYRNFFGTNVTMNGGHGQRNGMTLCLLTNPTAVCKITMVRFEFGDTVVLHQSIVLLNLIHRYCVVGDTMQTMFQCWVASIESLRSTVLCRGLWQRLQPTMAATLTADFVIVHMSQTAVISIV